MDLEKLLRLLTSQGTVTFPENTYHMIPEAWLQSARSEIEAAIKVFNPKP